METPASTCRLSAGDLTRSRVSLSRLSPTIEPSFDRPTLQVSLEAPPIAHSSKPVSVASAPVVVQHQLGIAEGSSDGCSRARDSSSDCSLPGAPNFGDPNSRVRQAVARMSSIDVSFSFAPAARYASTATWWVPMPPLPLPLPLHPETPPAVPSAEVSARLAAVLPAMPTPAVSPVTPTISPPAMSPASPPAMPPAALLSAGRQPRASLPVLVLSL